MDVGEEWREGGGEREMGMRERRRNGRRREGGVEGRRRE